MMFFNIAVGLLGFLTGVLCRDMRSAKPLPAISNSLLNFGKMDISFYLSDKFKVHFSDTLTKQSSHTNQPSPFSSPHDTPLSDEPCPCSGFRNIKEPFSSHPSEILNKVLMSNDFFSFNKELPSSTLCCDSHENVREESVFFEFSPKQSQLLANPLQSHQIIFPSLKKVLENVFPRRPTLPMEAIKPPAVDIFLFPKKKTGMIDENELMLKKKPDIHAVGDNEIKESMKIYSPMLPNKSSVKKDLGKKTPVNESSSVSVTTVIDTSSKSNTI
ncbi:uncharacterized protein [Battus philenor]|uniref:uncharacterized protein n=1 Tax=Battus philenor TaxID=42288 RepID=UPI0035CFFD51